MIKRQPKRFYRRIEGPMQALVFRILQINEGRYPDLRWVHAIANGGGRHPVIAMQMKQEGVKRGIADIFVPIPDANGKFLYIEIKTIDGRQTTEQKEFEQYCKERTNGKLKYFVARSARIALRLIEEHTGYQLTHLPSD